MKKTILITGSTDGIGLATAKQLVKLRHKVLLHGRDREKLEAAKQALLALTEEAEIQTYLADLSSMTQTENMARQVIENNSELDVLINNAGIFKTAKKHTDEGLDLRFAVNTLAPYLLTKSLLPIVTEQGRIINLSSAAQAPVEPEQLAAMSELADSQVYAQSKLAIIMWSNALADELGASPVICSVNPKSFLGSKMVKEAYGVAGGDVSEGADILVSATLSQDFAHASGMYFDNDINQFTTPHHYSLDKDKCRQVLNTIDKVIKKALVN